MRAFIFNLLSLAPLFAVAGCDPDADDLTGGSGFGADDPVSFRCLGGCFQSPYLGTFDISNLNEVEAADATSPDGQLTVRWTRIVKGGQEYAELRVSDLAKCEIRRHSTSPWEGCEGSIIDLSMVRGSTLTTGKIWIKALGTDSNGPLTVYKYRVKGDLDPITDQVDDKFPFDVCPEGDDDSHLLVMLPDVQTLWTGGGDGLGELVASTSTRFTLACDGYAQAKGYTRARVLPATGGARNYGVANYNAITHAMRALFRRHGSTDQYDALTEHGTPIAIKDLLHSPPLFDELDNSPPIIGYGEYLLESVYNGLPNLQSGRKGATCKKPYVNFPCDNGGSNQFPYGVHRRPEFSPPILDIPGWSDLPECDTQDLGDFGAVGVYGWYEGTCSVSEW